MKALITGITGFVGSHMSSFLLERGFDVFGLDKALNGYDKITYFSVDITEKKRVFEAIRKSKPDFIFHFAAISSVTACEENKELARAVNLGGTENILSACADNSIKARILIPSSAYVYGLPMHDSLDESHPINPSSEYGILKVGQEKVASRFFNKDKLSVVIIRSFNHIGPNQTTGFVCSDFAKQIAEIEKGLKEPIIKVGNLESKRDFTDVRDIVKAYLLALEKCKPNEVYNLCSGKIYSIKQILDIMLSLTEQEIKIEIDPSKTREDDIQVIRGNNSKFVRATGWEPEIPIEKTLKDLLDYWRKHT